MPEAKSKAPEAPAAPKYPQMPEPLEAKDREILELIDWHWRWVTSQLPSGKHSLAMRSDAMIKNIGVRIDLLKVERGGAGALGLSLDEVLGALSAEGRPPTVDDGAGGENPAPAAGGDE